MKINFVPSSETPGKARTKAIIAAAASVASAVHNAINATTIIKTKNNKRQDHTTFNLATFVLVYQSSSAFHTHASRNLTSIDRI